MTTTRRSLLILHAQVQLSRTPEKFTVARFMEEFNQYGTTRPLCVPGYDQEAASQYTITPPFSRLCCRCLGMESDNLCIRRTKMMSFRCPHCSSLQRQSAHHIPLTSAAQSSNSSNNHHEVLSSRTHYCKLVARCADRPRETPVSNRE